MGYKQKYYTFGTVPYVYDWRGSTMQPSKTHNEGLGSIMGELPGFVQRNAIAIAAVGGGLALLFLLKKK